MKKLKYCIGVFAFCSAVLFSSKTASARITYDLNGNKVDVMGSSQLTKESGEYTIIAPSLKTKAYFDKDGNLLKLINYETGEVVINNTVEETTKTTSINKTVYDLNGNPIKESEVGDRKKSTDAYTGNYQIESEDAGTTMYYNRYGELIKVINTKTGKIIIDNSKNVKSNREETTSTQNNDIITLAKVKGIKKSVKYKYITTKYKSLNNKIIKRKNKYVSSYLITWNKVKGATGYEVYRYESAKKVWTKISTTKKAKYEIKEMAYNENAKIKVRAYKNNKTYGQYSKVLSFKNSKNGFFKKNNKGALSKWASEDAFVIQNKLRKKAGVQKLVWNDKAYELACIRLKTLNKDGFSHKYIGRDTKKWLNDSYKITDSRIINRMSLCGENIAQSQDPIRAMRMWKNSPGHYKNLIKEEHYTGAIALGYGNGCAMFWGRPIDEIINNEYLDF